MNMRKHLLESLTLCFILIAFVGCQPYVQIYKTAGDMPKDSNGHHVYENDTLKIIYTFWSEKGVLSFALFNKLSVPIYLDWKKSAYIDNSTKLNYWNDIENITSYKAYSGYFYKGPLIKPGFEIGNYSGISVSTVSKPERVTFIPPRSFFFKSQFYILPVEIHKLELNTPYEQGSPSGNRIEKTKLYTVKFNKNNSPKRFRNFLTFSTSEKFESEFYVDNEFFIEEILEMDRKKFEYFDEQGNSVIFDKYVKPCYFYKRIPNRYSVDGRLSSNE